MNAAPPVKPAAGETAPPPAPGRLAWLADRPWLLVTAAFALLISVWAVFFTLALTNPVRDVLKEPLPAAPASPPSDDAAAH